MSFCAKKKYLKGNHSKEHYNVATVLNIKLRGQLSNFCDLGTKMLYTLECPWKLQIHIHVNIYYIYESVATPVTAHLKA